MVEKFAPGCDHRLLVIGDAVGTAGADDITLTGGDLTLNVTGTVTQKTGDVITASGLQLLGNGNVNLDDANNVTTLAASHTGTISYRDINALVVGTVTDSAMGTTTTNGITNNGDVKLTVDSVGPVYFLMTHGAGGPIAFPALADRLGDAVQHDDPDAIRRHAGGGGHRGALPAVPARADLQGLWLERLAVQHLRRQGALYVARPRAPLQQAGNPFAPTFAISAPQPGRGAGRLRR